MAKSAPPKLIDGQWWLDGPDGRAVWDEAAQQWRVAPSQDIATGTQAPRPSQRQGFVRRCAPFVVVTVVTLDIVAAFLWADKASLHWITQADQTAQVSSTPQVAAPDRVVGVLRECTGGYANAPTALTDVACSVYGVRGDHLHLTIRQASGATYEADVTYDASVAIGDTWPRQ